MNAEPTSTPVATAESDGPFIPAPTGRTACVIGSGFGGLALNTLLKTVALDSNAVQRHRATVLDCLLKRRKGPPR